MNDAPKDKALYLLYSQLKQTRISLAHAEQRRNNWEERENLKNRIVTLEWIIGVVIEKEA